MWGLSVQVKLYESHSKAMMKDQSGLHVEEHEASPKAGLSHIFQVSHSDSGFVCRGTLFSSSCAFLSGGLCICACTQLCMTFILLPQYCVYILDWVVWGGFVTMIVAVTAACLSVCPWTCYINFTLHMINPYVLCI